jgi:hypothetical protein
VNREANARDVVLIQFRHGVYNSPAPASFLRTGKPLSTVSQTYSPRQYMSLVVSTEIAAGATGVVHNATLEVSTTSDGIRSLKVVVKFSFERRQQKKLRHEFSIYEHLASSRINGIPTVFGLFEDTESDTLALVMTHVGICLLDRGPDASKITVVDSKNVRLNLKTVSDPKTVSDSRSVSNSNATASNIRWVLFLIQAQVY